MDYRAIFTIDFETTGKEAADAFAIEAAIATPDDGAYGLSSFIALPEGQTIPAETSAVHHIIDEDLAGAPDWAEVLDALWGSISCGGEYVPQQVVMVAHNSEYEQTVLADTIFDQCNWVCTWKVAMHLWPEAPSHSNEGLRYWLQLGRRGRQGPKDSHSALHDAKVTAGIFAAALRKLMDSGLSRDQAIGQMIAWSKDMPALPTCPIGKERGKKWSEIDSGFLSWALRQPDMRKDVQHCAREELERRRRADR